MPISVPAWLESLSKDFSDSGHQLYLVGGAVRDELLGKEVGEWDLATDAKPSEVEQILHQRTKKIGLIGKRFGTVTADLNGNQVEITTFRGESYEEHSRKPVVKFGTSIDEDLSRRDFTINAIAYDLRFKRILDSSYGERDLKAKVIRAVGNPESRFREDPLRMLRAIRFAVTLDFEIEPNTFEAIKQSIPVAKQVSMERIRDEFMKLLLNSAKPSKGVELMRETGLLNIFLPELLEGYGVEQKLYHAHDVYTHSLRTCDFAEDSVKLAALLHDIAKPRTDMGNGHFYGHDVVGVEMVEDIMKRLKFSKSEIERTKLLVKNHMFYYPHSQQDIGKEKEEKLSFSQWSDSAVRRFLNRVGEENVEDLFKLRIADATSNPNSPFQPEEITELQKHISRVRAQDMALKITDLDINGEDLQGIGIKPGPQMGSVLKRLLDIVIEDPLMNTKEKLLDEAI